MNIVRILQSDFDRIKAFGPDMVKADSLWVQDLKHVYRDRLLSAELADEIHEE